MCQKLSQTAEAWILSPAVGVQVESSKWRETAHSAALCPHTPRETGIQPHISEDHKSLPWICNLTAARSWVIPPVRIISCLRIGGIVPPSSSEDVKSSCHVFLFPLETLFLFQPNTKVQREDCWCCALLALLVFECFVSGGWWKPVSNWFSWFFLSWRLSKWAVSGRSSQVPVTHLTASVDHSPRQSPLTAV